MSIKTGIAYFKVLVPDAESIPDFDSFVRGSALQLKHHLIADWKVDSSSCPFVVLTVFLHSDRDENGILDVAIAADVTLMLDGVSESCVIVTASPHRIKPDPEPNTGIKAGTDTTVEGEDVTRGEQQEAHDPGAELPATELAEKIESKASTAEGEEVKSSDADHDSSVDLSGVDIPRAGEGLPFWKSMDVAVVESDPDQSFIEATALRLSRTAFMKNVDKASLKFIEVHLGYCAHHRQGPTMAHDKDVHYYRFKQDGRWIYFFERGSVRFYFRDQ